VFLAFALTFRKFIPIYFSYSILFFPKIFLLPLLFLLLFRLLSLHYTSSLLPFYAFLLFFSCVPFGFRLSADGAFQLMLCGVALGIPGFVHPCSCRFFFSFAVLFCLFYFFLFSWVLPKWRG